MCIPSFNILALQKFLRKLQHKFLMLTCNIGKERKMGKTRKTKAMTLRLNPTIQSLILQMYIIFEDSSLHSSRENCDTNLALKAEKMDK